MTNRGLNGWTWAFFLIIAVYGILLFLHEGFDLGVDYTQRKAVKAGVGEYIMTDPSNPKTVTFIWKTNQTNYR